MADHNAGVEHATLVAATIDRVTFTQGNPTEIEVFNRGSGDNYLSTDGTDSTVEGDDTCVVGAGESLAVCEANKVRLIPAAYSIMRAH